MRIVRLKHILSFLLLSLFIFFAVGSTDDSSSNTSNSGSTEKVKTKKSIIGTYTGSSVIAGARFDVTVKIESETSCKIRWTSYANSWDRYNMRFDGNKTYNLGGGTKLVSTRRGFDVYFEGEYFCRVTK